MWVPFWREFARSGSQRSVWRWSQLSLLRPMCPGCRPGWGGWGGWRVKKPSCLFLQILSTPWGVFLGPRHYIWSLWPAWVNSVGKITFWTLCLKLAQSRLFFLTTHYQMRWELLSLEEGKWSQLGVIVWFRPFTYKCWFWHSLSVWPWPNRSRPRCLKTTLVSSSHLFKVQWNQGA